MTRDEIEQWVRLGAAALGIAIRPEWQATIVMHMRMSLAHAARLDGVALTDHAEPDPVSRA